MSSGSSGRRVALPEPSFFSMADLMSRIVASGEMCSRGEPITGKEASEVDLRVVCVCFVSLGSSVNHACMWTQK